MRMMLWFGLAAGGLTILGGILGFRPLIAIGAFGLLLALISLPFSGRPHN